ncbi:MFS transporter [Renibacterium salmoninarum ATCC 33209]|uniref:MFS transporter n=1 Tax=Renibacterium salmoninarum (strain ATCC 33209 / DSM 20767 / JCM 11484 / NBRC 15589 / NCIMB 2235) TaxID=288705 RepID=A9WL64_RENSM|nr:MFS transporter [Renibacterium salmoninarum ATCC 33209]
MRTAWQGAVFVYQHRVIRAVVVIGTLETIATGVRVMLPAVAVVVLGGGPTETGLLFSAIPIGAVIASLLSGWLAGLRRPGTALIGFALMRDLVSMFGVPSRLWPTQLLVRHSAVCPGASQYAR